MRFLVASPLSLHYATPMLKFVLPLLLLLPGLSHAVICKSVAADGVVSYADVAPGECAEQIKLPDYSRYAPRPIGNPSAQSGNQTVNESEFRGYQSMRFEQPESGSVIRDDNGNVPVSIALQPRLQPGHRITIRLDGLNVDGTFTGTSLKLTKVERGSHRLSATVFDEDGRALISASSGSFTLRKRSLLDPGREDGPTPPPPGPTGSSNFPPNYTPGTGGISTTPSKTNPSFAPKYSP